MESESVKQIEQYINSNRLELNEQVAVWKQQYLDLHHKMESEKSEWQKREEKGMKLIKQYQEENDKMQRTNQLGVQLIENLKKQIEKYQHDDVAAVAQTASASASNHDDLNLWKSRYLTEKRTSEYLRAECEDLQNEIEDLKNENIDSKNIVNEAWAEQVAVLIEEQKGNAMEVEAEVEPEPQAAAETDYKALYAELVQSKLRLVDETSGEIQRLRKIIYSQNTTVYRNLFDRIARYHNLDGTEDQLFQLIIDAQLKPSQLAT